MTTTLHRTSLSLLLRTLAAGLVLLSTSACQTNHITQVRDFPEGGQTMPSRLSIVTWNAQKGQHPDFKAKLQQLLDDEQPDLVFLQEATADLLNSAQIGGYFAGSWRYPWPGGKTIGLLSLSRIAPVDITPLPSRQREFMVTAPKLSLLTVYPLPNGERLLAVNVHILAFERWSTRGMRRQLHDLAVAIGHHSGPVILLGDLNTWSERRLAAMRRMAQDVALTEVTDFPPGRRAGAGSSGWLRWLLGVDPDLPLDRVFQRGFEDHHAQVLPYKVSDHRPLLVTLSLRGQSLAANAGTP